MARSPDASFGLIVVALLAAASALAAAGECGEAPPVRPANCPRVLVAAGGDPGRAVCGADHAALAGELAAAAHALGCEVPAAWSRPGAGQRLRLTAAADGTCSASLEELGGAERLALGLPIPLALATEADLARLPGVGPRLARAIVAARAEGRLAALDDLLAVKGIGPRRLAALRGLLDGPISAATAPPDRGRSSCPRRP
jgi:predicted flap endonuclease-1-like 5' DNA nuclease